MLVKSASTALGYSEKIKTTKYSYMPNTNNPHKDLVISEIEEAIDGVPYSVRQFKIYDKNSNPIQVSEDSLSNSVYLWGYSGKYIVARIENATFAEVTSLLGEDLPSDEEELVSAVDSLRAKLPDALIRTYRYRPLVGMISETDPSGRTLFYDYDDHGRLSERYLIHNGKKEIVETIDYHLVNE